MPEWKKDRLEDGMFSNPVLVEKYVGLSDEIMTPTLAELSEVFPDSNSIRIKTWGRSHPTQKTSVLDPHWLCLTQGTGMHTDPMYPRYTHQLYVYVDPMLLHGLAFHRTILKRGLYVCLDTHSPHKVSKLDKRSRWYLAAAIDSNQQEPFDKMHPILMEYVKTAPFPGTWE
jgi:hypothetical protein